MDVPLIDWKNPPFVVDPAIANGPSRAVMLLATSEAIPMMLFKISEGVSEVNETLGKTILSHDNSFLPAQLLAIRAQMQAEFEIRLGFFLLLLALSGYPQPDDTSVSPADEPIYKDLMGVVRKYYPNALPEMIQPNQG